MHDWILAAFATLILIVTLGYLKLKSDAHSALHRSSQMMILSDHSTARLYASHTVRHYRDKPRGTFTIDARATVVGRRAGPYAVIVRVSTSPVTTSMPSKELTALALDHASRDDTYCTILANRGGRPYTFRSDRLKLLFATDVRGAIVALWWIPVVAMGISAIAVMARVAATRKRRSSRLKHSLCLACGYDLGNLSRGVANSNVVCPECGNGRA